MASSINLPPKVYRQRCEFTGKLIKVDFKGGQEPMLGIHPEVDVKGAALGGTFFLVPIGQCVLSSTDLAEFIRHFRQDSHHSCRWPDGHIAIR